MRADRKVGGYPVERVHGLPDEVVVLCIQQALGSHVAQVEEGHLDGAIATINPLQLI